MKEIEVPDVGVFEFPDNITDEQAELEIQEYLKSQGIEDPYGSKEPGLVSSATRGLVGAQQSMTANAAVAGIIDPETGAAEIARLEREKTKYPTPKAVEAFFASGNDAGALARNFIKAPLTVVSHIVAESLGTSAPAAVTGAAGAAAGALVGGVGALPGLAVGVGAGSAAMEFGSKFLDTLSELGVDLKDPISIQAAFGNEQLMSEAKAKGVRKGIPIGVMDGLSAGIAGRFVNAARTAGKGITKAAAGEVALQSAMGAGGEAAGQALADQKFSLPEIAAEAVGELGPGAVEVGAGALIRREPRVAPPPAEDPDIGQKLLTYEKKGQLLLEDLRPDIELLAPPEDPQLELPAPPRSYSPEDQSQPSTVRGPRGRFERTSTGFVMGEQLPLSDEAATFKREQDTRTRQLRQQQLREQAAFELGEKGLDIVSGRLEAIDVNDVPGNLVQRLRARDIKLGISDVVRSVYFREDLQGLNLRDEDVNAILGTTPEVTPNEIPISPNVTRGQFTMALRNILSDPKASIDAIKKAADFRGPNADLAARELLQEMARTGLAKASKDGRRFTIGKEERKAIELAVAAETPNGGIEAGTMQREGFTGTPEQIAKQNGLFKRDGTPFKSAGEFDTELEALRAERQQLQDQVLASDLTPTQRTAGADRLRYFNRYIQKLEAAATSPAMQRLRTYELDQPRTAGARADEAIGFDTSPFPTINGEVRFATPDVGVAQMIARNGDTIFAVIHKDGWFMPFDVSTAKDTEFGLINPAVVKQLRNLGISMRQRHTDAILASPRTPFDPKLGHQTTGKVTFAGIEAEYASVLDGWRKMLGLDENIFLVSKDQISDPDWRLANGFGRPFYDRVNIAIKPNNMGLSVAHEAVDGLGNIIVLDTSMQPNVLLETMAHEMGHVIESRMFSKEPDSTKQAIMDDYNQWFISTRAPGQKAIDVILKLRAPGMAIRTINLPDPQFPRRTYGERLKDMEWDELESSGYYTSFPEWFADNVSKWATSAQRPMSVVEKFFAAIATKMKKLWESMSQTVRGKPTTEISQSMEEFLERMVDRTTRMDYTTGTRAQVQTPLQNAWRRVQARFASPREASVDPSAPDQETSDTRGYGQRLDEHTTRVNAARSLDDVLTDAEPAQNWLRKDFSGSTSRMRAEDMGWASFWMRHPMQVATKSRVFEPVWRFIYARFRQQSRIIAEAEDGAITYRKLSTPERANVNKALNLGDQVGIEWNIANSLRPDGSLKINDALTLSPKEVEGYIAVRKSINFMWKEMIKAFNAGLNLAPETTPAQIRTMAAALKAAGKRAQAARMETAADTLGNMIGAYRKGYMPHMRFGDHGVKVTDADGKTVWYEARDIPEKRGREKALREWREELQKKFPASKGFKASPPFYLTRDSIKREVGDVGSDIDRLISAFGNKDMEFWKEVHAELDEMLSRQGFLAHQRQRMNVPGYSEDWGRVLDTYFKRGANFVAYQTFRRQVNDAMKGIPETMPRLRKYAEDYVQYAMGPVEEFQTIRNVTFNWFFGFNLSLGLINMTQVPMATVPYLTRFAGEARIAKEIARAYKDVATMINLNQLTERTRAIDPTKAPKDVRADLVRDFNESVLFPLQTADFTGLGTPGFQSTSGRSKKLVERVTKTGAFVFQIAEETNRIVTYIASHRLARDPKVAKRIQEAMAANPRWAQNPQSNMQRKFAAFSVEETQFLMGKINRPKVMRGPGAVALQFMSFPFQMLELIGRLATTYKAGKPVTSKVLNKQLAIMALFLFATAGVWGLPFAENLKDMFQMLYKIFTKKGIDLDLELRELVQEMGGDPITSDALSRGIVRSLTGLDVSKRLSLGAIIPDGLFKGDVTDAIGAGPSTLVNGLQRAMQRHASGQPLGMVLSEVSPVALKNSMQAIISQKVGVQTATGRQVMTPEEFTPGMASSKIAGFTSTSVAREFEKDFSQQNVSTKVRDLQSYYLNQLTANRVAQIRAARKGEQSDVAELKHERNKILREIKAHNKAAIANNEREALITLKVEDVRQKVAEVLNPNRRIKRFPVKARQAAQDIEDLYPE